MRIVGTTDYRGKPRVRTKIIGPSLTVQSDMEVADIHNIMRQFEQGGMKLLDEADLAYRDVSEFTDLQDAMNQAKEAEVEFKKLPSKIREIFNHDVAEWLDTAHDADKRQALVDKGYLRPDVEPVVEPEPEKKADGAAE